MTGLVIMAAVLGLLLVCAVLVCASWVRMANRDRRVARTIRASWGRWQ